MTCTNRAEPMAQEKRCGPAPSDSQYHIVPVHAEVHLLGVWLIKAHCWPRGQACVVHVLDGSGTICLEKGVIHPIRPSIPETSAIHVRIGCNLNVMIVIENVSRVPNDTISTKSECHHVSSLPHIPHLPQ